MASVSLETVWLNLASDLSKSVQLEVSSLNDDEGITGEVRVYAGGRTRSVSRAGSRRQIRVSFDVLDNRPQLATLRSWVGLTVLFRDPFGRKVYAVFYSVPAVERIPVDMPEVQLDLTGVTFSEAK